MARLPDLPNELLEQIMKYLLPDDVDNFSGSCEEFHAIASMILPRHKELKEKYSHFSRSDLDCEGTHLVCLLSEIIQDPEIAWYVKSIVSNAYYTGRPKNANREAEQIAVNCKENIIKTLQVCRYLNEPERQSWIERIPKWPSYMAFALLTTMLPCLEKIITDGWHTITLLRDLIEEIAQATRLDPGRSHALSKLEYVKEVGLDDDPCQPMSLIKALSTLPSIRRYEGRYLWYGSYLQPTPGKSTITSLELSECTIFTNSLRGLLGSIANLQHFTYKYNLLSSHGTPIWHRDWQPGKIVMSLLEHASHSLVELDLTENIEGLRRARRARIEGVDNPDISKPFIGSLQGFQILQNIRVHNEAFVEEESENSAGGRLVHRLVDLLPASVVELTLAMPQLSKEDSDRMMDGLPELKAGQVPKLKKIIVEGTDKKSVFKIDDIDLTLRELNI